MKPRLFVQVTLLLGLVLGAAGCTADTTMPSNPHHELPNGVMKKDPGETS